MSFYKDEQFELDRRGLAAVGVTTLSGNTPVRHIELTANHGHGDVIGYFTNETAALIACGIEANPNRGAA